MKEVLMPKMGLSMETGKIEEWKKKEGDKINEGDILFVISTEKISLEIEAYDSGYLRKIVANEGTEVPVTQVVAYIGELDEPIPGDMPGGEHASEETYEKTSARDIKTSIGESGTRSSETMLKISKKIPLTGIRKVIAEKMTYSMQNIPHIMQTVVVDVENLINLKQKINLEADGKNIKITYTDLLIKAAANLLAQHPLINSSFQDNIQIVYDDINISIGISTESGLMVATIYNADQKNIFEIANRRNEIVERARKNNLTAEDISNATFTISNLGMFGIRDFTALINPPMTAIMMTGEIYKSAVESDGKAVFKSFMNISMAVDHRVLDGIDSVKYLISLKGALESTEGLLVK
jgi:pyruvate dehydrogenase E2 component (dihydrolipoamide acetyltransferase)